MLHFVKCLVEMIWTLVRLLMGSILAENLEVDLTCHFMLKVSVNSMAAVNDGRTILRSNYVSNAHERGADL